MHDTGMPNGDPRGDEGDPREFSRIPVVIPVRVEVSPPPPEAGCATVAGALLDIGRGGGRVRVRQELPLHSRLFVWLPVGLPNLPLAAEVVWTSPPSDRGLEPSVYGVRWLEPLSAGILASVLLRQGLATAWEVGHAPRARK